LVDHVSRQRRSVMMSAVRGKHTAPELIVRKAAHALGLRFRLHGRHLPGRPDLVFPRWKTVVFVNGCFWHQHPGCKRTTVPNSNASFWRRKFRENIRRDATNYARLATLGWRVVILWQCELGRPGTLQRATDLLKSRFPFRSQKAGLRARTRRAFATRSAEAVSAALGKPVRRSRAAE
jgi:DNA mismatch endonuclease, patch repair protein